MPLVLLLSLYLGFREVPERSGYAVADLAFASYQVTLVGPLVTAWIAYRFAGFDNGLDVLVPIRTSVRAVVGAWWPLLLGPAVAVAVGMMVVTGSLPDSAAAWQVLAVTVLVMLACSGFGMLVARCLPAVVAVPVVAAVSFWWLAFPGSGTNIMLRNINGGFVVCCTPEQVPSTTMVRGSAVVASVIVLGTVLSWVMPRWTRWSRAVATAVSVAVCVGAVGAGTWAVEGAGARPTLQAVADRVTIKTCTTVDGLGVCTWPEDAHRIEDVRAIANHLNGRLVELGLPEVRQLEEDPRRSSAVPVAAYAWLSDADVAYSLAAGYVRWRASCHESHDVPVDAVAHVALLAGVSEQDLDVRFGRDVARRAARTVDAGRVDDAWLLGASGCGGES